MPTIFLCDVIGSVAALTLQDEGLVGPLDLNLFTDFLDLQALVVANNPGGWVLRHSCVAAYGLVGGYGGAQVCGDVWVWMGDSWCGGCTPA